MVATKINLRCPIFDKQECAYVIHLRLICVLLELLDLILFSTSLVMHFLSKKKYY